MKGDQSRRCKVSAGIDEGQERERERLLVEPGREEKNQWKKCGLL